MKKKNYLQRDEINLAISFKEIWDGRWQISGFIILALFVGFGYWQSSEIKYDVQIPYRTNIYSVKSEQMCTNNNKSPEGWRVLENCLNNRTLNIFLDKAGDEWSLDTKNKMIIHRTKSPLKEKEYKRFLSKIVKSTNGILLNEAINELKLIESIKYDNLQNIKNSKLAEQITINELNAKRIVKALQDNSQDAISFSSASRGKIFPKLVNVLVISIFFGGIIGVLFVFFRNSLKKLKK